MQIYLTRIGSRTHHRSRRAKERESTVVIEAGTSEEKLITDLRPFSHYEVAVTVFNSKGEGPMSEPLSFETNEGGKRARRTSHGAKTRMGGDEGEINYKRRTERRSETGNGNKQRRGYGRGDDDVSRE